MKKNSFKLFNRLFDSSRSRFPPFNFLLLPHLPFSTGLFNSFPVLNQLILTKNIGKKHYQVKLKPRFDISGTKPARLLSLSRQKICFSPIRFPQFPIMPNRVSLSNHINKASLPAKSPFLKSPAKITNQSGSNNVTISAENKFPDLFLKTNLAGNYHQGKSNNQNTPRNTGQIQSSWVNHLTPFNKINELYKASIPYTKNFIEENISAGPINDATNQATDIFDKNSDNLSLWLLDNSKTINLVYHHSCN